jgi:predicted nuclease with TOPRIM domain
VLFETCCSDVIDSVLFSSFQARQAELERLRAEDRRLAEEVRRRQEEIIRLRVSA